MIADSCPKMKQQLDRVTNVFLQTGYKPQERLKPQLAGVKYGKTEEEDIRGVAVNPLLQLCHQ